MRKFLVAFLVAAFTVAMSIPAQAFDTTFSGTVVWQMGYHSDSAEITENGNDSVVSGFMSVTDDSNLSVTFESKDKKVGVSLEMDLEGTLIRGPVFGWYTMGDFTLVAGHNDTWAGDGLIGTDSWLIDPTDGGFGLTGHETRPMIALEWNSANLGVQVGLFEPLLELDGVDDFGWVLPTLNVTLNAKFGSFQLAPNFGITHYTWESDRGDNSLVAWYVGLPAKVALGPVTLQLAGMYAVNGSADFATNELSAPVMTAAGEIENSTTFGGWAELIYSVGDVNIGGGAAWMRVENDTWENGDISQFKYYAYVSYALHENLTLQPEIGFTNFGDDTGGNDAGNSFQAGLQIEFKF